MYPLEIPPALYLPIPLLPLADLKDDIPNVHDKLILRGKPMTVNCQWVIPLATSVISHLQEFMCRTA